MQYLLTAKLRSGGFIPLWLQDNDDVKYTGWGPIQVVEHAANLGVTIDTDDVESITAHKFQGRLVANEPPKVIDDLRTVTATYEFAPGDKRTITIAPDGEISITDENGDEYELVGPSNATEINAIREAFTRWLELNQP